MKAPFRLYSLLKCLCVTAMLSATIFLAAYSSANGMVTFKPDHPYFQYTGRIDQSIPDKPVLYWPGTCIKTNFEGSLLVVMLEDQTGQSWYSVFIDEDYDHPRIIDCQSGNSIYLVSASLKDTVHSVLIFRRTEASTGPTKFLGIQINDGKNMLPPPPRPERRILFYGNSITCGMGNEAPDGSSDDNMAHENNFLAYGAIASRMLDADYMCIAKSGIGIMISWFDMIMPQYYYRLNPDNPDSLWNFDDYKADVVVINLFQNDSWLIGNLKPVPDSTQIISAYVNFVREIRRHHPASFIICSLGSMDATKAGSPWPGYIESAVKIMQTEDKDFNLDTYFFPFDPNWSKHPRVRHHKVMGQNLADYIKYKMNWVSGVEHDFNSEPPLKFGLNQNYPNPFNMVTTINYLVPGNSHITLRVYDTLGRIVTTLVDDQKAAGQHYIKVDGSDLCSGVYYYRLMGENFSDVKRFSLIR